MGMGQTQTHPIGTWKGIPDKTRPIWCAWVEYIYDILILNFRSKLGLHLDFFIFYFILIKILARHQKNVQINQLVER